MTTYADRFLSILPWTPPAGGWEPWLLEHVPTFCRHGFADHHRQLWEWVWAIQPGQWTEPLVAVFSRGGAKSTSAEMACAAVAARQARRYVLYVCGTQEQANDHVGNVGSILESREIGAAYPKLGQRRLSEFGYSEGWKVTRLRTASGFTIDAVGLDKAVRGVKLEEQRPDMIVFDDIDIESDGPDIVRKKIKRITTGILPAGSTDVAVLAVQNLVHPDSVFSQLVDGRADFLANRQVIGPIPAVRDLAYEQRDGRFVITGGTPTWEGQDLAACQEFVNRWGFSAFLHEAQHEVEPPPGGMYNHIDWQHCERADVPWKSIVRTVVWCDPAVTDTDQSDSQGVQCDAIAADETIYRLYSWEQRTSPLEAMKKAIHVAFDFGAEAVGVETDQGGDTWVSVFREAYREIVAELQVAGVEPIPACPQFRWDKAGAGHGSKTHRSSLMLADYEVARLGRIVHVRGTHLVLERALRRFPLTKPLDLADAAYWSWFDLRYPEPPAEQEFDYHDPVRISPV